MQQSISDAKTASAPTISTVVRRGLDALDDSITHAEAFDSGISKVTLEDERGRLKVWASNLGALQPATSPKSLDHRLRDAPLMRKSVSAGLDRVLISVARASHILDGSAPNRTGSPVPDDGDSGSEVRVKTELDELLLGIHSAISHLFGLSMLIRRQRPKGRLPVLESFQPAERSPDISNVTDKFPKAKSTPWLAQRLGNEITRRREIIRYRQHHREGLANTVNNKHEGRSDTATLATTFQEADLPGAATQNREAVTSSRVSVFTSGTSYLSAEDSKNTGRRIPDLSDMCLDGVQLQYGEIFECPYCRTIQEVNNRFEWKKHVMSDLQPYVCTFQDCSASTHLFPTRAEWFRHEFAVHRLQWACNWCDGPRASFDSAEGLERHFAKTHPGEVTDGQMPLILEACERPITTFGPSSCPLCTEWEALPPQNTAKGFGRHLARHLQHLALEALPLSIEGLEIRESEGLAEEEDVLPSDDMESADEEIASSELAETIQAQKATEADFLKTRQEEAEKGDKEIMEDSSFQKRSGEREGRQQSHHRDRSSDEEHPYDDDDGLDSATERRRAIEVKAWKASMLARHRDNPPPPRGMRRRKTPGKSSDGGLTEGLSAEDTESSSGVAWRSTGGTEPPAGTLSPTITAGHRGEDMEAGEDGGPGLKVPLSGVPQRPPSRPDEGTP